MKTRKLGDGLEASAIGLGCMGPSFGLGPATDRTEAIAVIRTAAEGGVTLFDTVEELLPLVLEGTIEPGRVFDRTVGLDDVPADYRAMAAREALKVLIRP